MKKITGIIIIALLTFGMQAYSQPTGKDNLRDVVKKLKLTDEQKSNADKIKVDMEKQMIAQKAKVETAQLELQQLLKADNPDKSDIEKKMNEIAELKVQMYMIRINSWFAMNSILTPEQQKIWKKTLVEGAEMRHQMMDRDEHKPMMKNRGKKQMHENEEMEKTN
jgi:Spy/CpxP family protein refolding chaperone